MSLVYVGFVPHPPIIVPEVGRGEEVNSEATVRSMQKLAKEIVGMEVQTILFVSPHAPLLEDGLGHLEGKHLSGNFGRFGAGQVKFRLAGNEPILARIKEEIPEAQAVGSELDHGVLVPLYFLLEAGWNGQIVVLSMPLRNPVNYGRKIGMILNDSPERCALIASGDLSHRLKDDGPYGFHPSGPKVDNLIVKGLKKDTTLVRGIPRP